MKDGKVRLNIKDITKTSKRLNNTSFRLSNRPKKQLETCVLIYLSNLHDILRLGLNNGCNNYKNYKLPSI